MAGFGDGVQKLLAYWGTIQAAVSERAGTAELWAAVRDAAASEGMPLQGVSAADMSVLRGIAGRQRTAMETLAGAAPGDAITGAMIAPELGSDGVVQLGEVPAWNVRFLHYTEADGEPSLTWRTDVFKGYLPPTKQELQDQLNQDAANMAADYGESHSGIGAVMITQL